MAKQQVSDRFNIVGSTLDGKFRVDWVVAEGGFGVVYYATHLMLDRPIALKVLKTPNEFNELAKQAFIDGFVREAKTSVRLSHPHIVQVLDFGVSELPGGVSAPWMALEWLDGQTLRETFMSRRGHGGRTMQECLAVLGPALDAVAYAHEEGVAHRDLKPANIILVTTRRGPILKLLDFGIAKVMEEGEEAGSGFTQTRGAFNAFSLMYAAPEQIGGSRTGPWTDVHALALIIGEFLTDQPAYEGKERTEICAAALSMRRPTPGRRNVNAGPWEPVLAKALSIRASDRYRNAREFYDALLASVGQPTTGPAPIESHHAEDEVTTIALDDAAVVSEISEPNVNMTSMVTSIEAMPQRAGGGRNNAQDTWAQGTGLLVTQLPAGAPPARDGLTAKLEPNAMQPTSRIPWLLAGAATLAVAGAVASFLSLRAGLLDGIRLGGVAASAPAAKPAPIAAPPTAAAGTAFAPAPMFIPSSATMMIPPPAQPGVIAPTAHTATAAPAATGHEQGEPASTGSSSGGTGTAGPAPRRAHAAAGNTGGGGTASPSGSRTPASAPARAGRSSTATTGTQALDID